MRQNMLKCSVVALSTAMLLGSCTTGAGAGAYAGGSLGSILGSAIGGIAGGPRGSDIGTIIGMAGGAVVGSALGNAAEQQQRADQHEMLARRNQRIQREKAQRGQRSQYQDDGYGYQQEQTMRSGDAYVSGDDTIDPSKMVDNSNSGDDRIDFEAAPPKNNVATVVADSTRTMEASRVEQLYADKTSATGKLTIKNVRFADADGDGTLAGGEIGHVTFEIYNNTQAPVYNFEPSVVEPDGNNRIYISPNIRVENINPGQGIRYTATVKADKRIKDGQIRLFVSAQKDGKPISYITVVKVKTKH